MKRVKHFTHNDLDGVSCKLISILAFSDCSVDIETCDYGNINEKIENFLFSSEVRTYDELYITDIGISDDVAKCIDVISEAIKVVFLDHHKTSLWMNDKYTWARVEVEDSKSRLTCGTELYFNTLSDILRDRGVQMTNLEIFVEYIRLYDTWDWIKSSDNIANELNTLFQLLDESFIYDMIKIIESDNIFGLTEIHKILIQTHERSKIKHLRSINITPTDIEEYLVGVAFADRNQSYLGHELATMHPNFDFIMLVDLNKRKLSLRSNKSYIDLGEISKKYFGGGGHVSSAGAELNELDMNVIIHDLLPNSIRRGRVY